MKTLAEIKKHLLDIMPEGIDLTFQAIKNILAEGTDQYKDLILLESRYKEAIRQMALGVLAYDVIQLELNKIRQDISNFIDGIQESHLKQEEGAAGDSRPDIYNGEVMYRIPKKMKQSEEVKCIVRLAFDRKVLMENLEEEAGDVLKDIRIAEVMGVELIDAGEGAFKIRTINDAVQFVEKDLYTEWIFYVMPVLPGTHPLILKISVIEILNGIERKRNVVLEEKVEILTTQPATAPETGFSSAGYVMQMASGQAVAGAENTPVAKNAGTARPAPDAPAQAPPPPPPPPPSTMPSAPRSGNFKRMTGALAGLVVLLVASWAIYTSIKHGNEITQIDPADKKAWETARENSTREELEAFVDAYPGSEFKDDAEIKLDSIETAAWYAALASNNNAAIRRYMIEYPEGRYYNEAIVVLEFNEDPATAGQSEDPVIAPVPEIKPAGPETRTNPGKKKVNRTGTSGKVSPEKQTGTPPVPPDDPKVTEPEKEDPNKPITKPYASRMPVHSGCDHEDKRKEEACTEGKIRKHILRYLEYPKEARRQGIKGTVVVEFVVELDGRVSNVRAKNDPGGGTAEEAVRIVEKLTRFKPGLNREGKPARILYIVPIKFELAGR